MNPIANLCGKKFKELNAYELTEVVNAYCDQNKYFNCTISKAYKNKNDVVKHFQTYVGGFFLAELFFREWTE